MSSPMRPPPRARRRLLSVTVWFTLFAQTMLACACRTSPPPGPAPETAPSQTTSVDPASHASPATSPRLGVFGSASSAGANIPAPPVDATSPLVAVRPLAPPKPEGPTPRTVDTPRDAVIEQVRPWVGSCFEASGRSGSGRVRVVLRLRANGTVQQADATVTGTLDPRLGACSEKSLRAQKFVMQRDTPLFLSFPLVLPDR